MLELIGRLHQDEGRAGNQVVGPQKPVNTELRDEVAVVSGVAHGELSGGELRLIQCQFKDRGTDGARDSVPDPLTLWLAVHQGVITAFTVAPIPAVENRLRDAQLTQRSQNGQHRVLHQVDDLAFLGCRVAHVSLPPAP